MNKNDKLYFLDQQIMFQISFDLHLLLTDIYVTNSSYPSAVPYYHFLLSWSSIYLFLIAQPAFYAICSYPTGDPYYPAAVYILPAEDRAPE